jgi:uncharacterized protein with HEPN domain
MKARMEFPDPVQRAIEMAQKIQSSTESLEFSDYLADGLIQAANEMMLIHLGTAFGRMRHLGIRHGLQSHASTLFQLRTYLIHATRDIDHARVWNAIRSNIPEVLVTLPAVPRSA